MKDNHYAMPNAPGGATERCDNCQQYCGGPVQCGCCTVAASREEGLADREPATLTPETVSGLRKELHVGPFSLPGARPGATTAAQDKEAERTSSDD
jgi:hypothetical protein